VPGEATAMTALVWDRQLVDELQSVDRGRATHDLDDVNRAPGAEESRGYYPPPHGTVHRGGGIGCASLCHERCTAPDAKTMRAELVNVVTVQLA
jgi:hypothetical protein